MNENETKWDRFLIRQEFFKLYFENLSLSDFLNVHRLTDLYDITRNKSNDNFHFAIIRYKLNSEIIENKKNYDQIRRQKSEIINTKNNDILLMFPKDNDKFDDSINFLSLAYSGFANVNEKQSKLFIKDDDNKNYLKTMLNDFKYKKEYADDDLDYKDEIDRQDSNLKYCNELRLKHNNIVKKTLGGHIENIPPIRKDKNSHFSLFFFKDSTLYEFTGHDMMLREVKKNVSNNSVRGNILDEILKTGEENAIVYQNDITIFSETYEQVNEDVNINSEGSLIIVLISIIFIINFFQTNPQKYLYQYSKTSQEFFELNHSTGINNIENFSNLSQVVDYFSDFIFPTVFNNNTYYQNLTNNMNKFLNTTSSLISNSVLKTSKIVFNPLKYYPFNMNILCGILISFKRIAKYSENGYSKRNGTFQFYNPIYLEDTSEYSLFSYDYLTNPIVGGSFNHYIKPYFKNNKLKYQKDILKSIKDKYLNLFSYTIMLYNANIETTHVYSISFELSSMSTMGIKRFQQSFTPFINENKKVLVQILILNIIYVIGFIYVVFLVSRTFSHHFIDLIKSKKYSFEWHDWVDLIVLIICFCSQILFYKLYLFSSNVFPIQIKDSETYSYWLSYAQDSKNYNRITGLAIFFITVRLIRILYTSFPNFGIVFQTLSLASGEIMAYIFLLITLIFSVTMLSYLNFGWYSNYFRYLGDTIINIFMMLTGNFDYPSISNSNRQAVITPYFYVFFMFFYNLILINVFLLTIRNNYADVKEKDQKFNEAFALMIADKSVEFQNKFLNFLLCGDPTIEDEKPKYDEIQQENVKKIDEEEEIQKKREREKVMYKIPIWTKIKINFEKLNIKQLLFGGNAWTREEFENNKKRKFKEIEQSSLISSIEDLEVDYEKEFDQLSDTLIYVLYIFIFLIVVILQLEISSSSLFDRSNKEFINENLASFRTITRFSEINDSLVTFFKNAYHVNNSNFRDNNNTFNPFFIPGYVFLQPPYFRLTLRILDFVTNLNSYENKLFPYILMKSFGELDMSVCGSDLEKRKTIIGAQNTEYKYITPSLSGVDSTPNSCGGYVYLMNQTNPFSHKDNDYKLDNYLNTFFLDSVGYVVLDWVMTNIHYNNFIYVMISFGRSTVGIVNYSNHIVSIPINLYKHIKDYTRLSFEIVFLMFFLYYGFILTNTIILILKKYLKKDFEKDPEKEKFRHSNYINQFLRIDLKSRENDSISTALLYFIWKIIERFISFSFFLLNSLIDYLKESVYNVLELITFTLTLVAIGMWIKIIRMTSSINLSYIKKEANFVETLPNNYLLSEVEELNNFFHNYCFVLSMNIFVYTLKTIRFFRFSKSIYNLVKIIDLSKNTIIFHLIFVAVIYAGFVIWGFALFGQQMYEFSTLSLTISELWTILGGDANYTEYAKIDNIWASAYVFTYVFLNSLILFNILNAIVIETYKEIKHRQEQNMAENSDKNFLENVITIINNKYNIFLYTSNEYYKILMKVYNDLIKNYVQQLKDGLSNNSRSGIQDYNVSSIENYIIVMTSFMKVINKKINQLEKIALRIIPMDCYMKDLDPLEEQKYIEQRFRENYNKSKQQKITKYEEVSIWVKMFAYIMYSIHSEQKEDNIENGKDSKYNLFDIEDITIYMQHKTQKNEKKKEKDKVKKQRREKCTEKNEFIKKQIFTDLNVHHTELNKYYEDLCNKRSDLGFLKKNLFKKEKKLKLNKKASNNIAYYFSHTQYYHFLIPKKNRLYNIDFVLNCNKHERNMKYDLSCDNCYGNFYSIYNTYVIVYDLFVKFFYLPEKISLPEKELYIGYYLCKMKEGKKNSDDDIFNNKKIFEFKYNKFLNELEAVSKMENIKNNFETLRDLEILSNKLLQEKKLNKKASDDDDEFIEYNPYNNLKKIYKKFVIWNCIYLIILKKYPYFIKEIKESSVSFKILKSSKEEYGKNNFFKDFFTKMFDLHYRESNYKINKIDVIYIKQKLREYVAKTQTEIETFDISNRSFYEKEDRFMIDDDSIYNIDNIIPQVEYENKKIIYKPHEFELLIYIWNSWKTKEEPENQFYIFFGYSKIFENLKNTDKFANFIKKELLKKKDFDWKIYYFFTDRHRAELLKNLPFSNKFVKEFFKKMKEFRDKNNINDAGHINSVHSFEDMLNYISLMKINYMKYYDLIMSIFDKFFRPVRNIIKSVDEKYKSLFSIIKFEVYNSLDNIYLFIDLYKLLISREKFVKISSIYQSSESKMFGDSINDDEDHDDDKMKPERIIEEIDTNIRIKKMVDQGEDTMGYDHKILESSKSRKDTYENIIFAFSLDPFQLIDVIRNIDDDNLKEFYFLLMVYIFDDFDYTQLTGYLERQTQYSFLHKYKYYSTFLEEKDIVVKQKVKYENQKSFFTYIYNYSKFLKDKVYKISEVYDRTLKRLKNDAEEQIKKLSEKD